MDSLSNCLAKILTDLPDRFEQKYSLDGQAFRSRKLTPKSFCLSMFRLVSGAGNEGIDHALIRVFGDLHAPRRSAFSQIRKKISYHFFADILKIIQSDFAPKMGTYLGYTYTAMMGGK